MVLFPAPQTGVRVCDGGAPCAYRAAARGVEGRRHAAVRPAGYRVRSAKRQVEQDGGASGVHTRELHREGVRMQRGWVGSKVYSRGLDVVQ
ncbi:hypothetical protein B0H19DRAFT_1202145 [Mycena capillaripes]|nr:hypothetical protein B0H19DRAFT_1202145 [Mycena capillaripes]